MGVVLAGIFKLNDFMDSSDLSFQCQCQRIKSQIHIKFGPIQFIHNQGFGFVEFQNEIDAEYAVRVTGNVALYGKKIRVNKANMDKKTLEVGANLFISNLAPEVDEDALKTTFMAFGQFACEPKVSLFEFSQAQIARDPETNISKGYGFVNYTSFEASDYAIESMNGQVGVFTLF